MKQIADLPPKKWTGFGRHTLSESWADQSQDVVQFAIGKQPSIGYDRRATKLEHQATVEIEPQSALIHFTVAPPITAPVNPRAMLNFISEL